MQKNQQAEEGGRKCGADARRKSHGGGEMRFAEERGGEEAMHGQYCLDFSDARDEEEGEIEDR